MKKERILLSELADNTCAALTRKYDMLPKGGGDESMRQLLYKDTDIAVAFVKQIPADDLRSDSHDFSADDLARFKIVELVFTFFTTDMCEVVLRIDLQRLEKEGGEYLNSLEHELDETINAHRAKRSPIVISPADIETTATVH